MAAKRRVVITGLGVATPIGIGIEPFWDALIQKRCGIGRLTSFDPSGMAAQVGGELPPFQLGDHIPKSYRKSIKVMSRDIVVAVVAAYHAVKDAGLRTKCLIERGEVSGESNIDSTRFGANIGAGLVCADLKELAEALATGADDDGTFSLARWGEEGMTNLTPLWLLKFLPNMLACHVTIVHDAQAPSNTMTCGEASSHLAIGEAFRTIARGRAAVCLCGGAESKTNPMAMARPLLCGRLNTQSNDQPDRACRPFSAGRAGGVVAEGGGLVILESLDHARNRQARIYGEVVGFGASSSIESWTKPDSDGTSIALSLEKALADADTGVDEIQLVGPLGTGIVTSDAAEMAGWTRVFGDRLERVPALTTLGAVGNNGAGSGAINFAAAVMSLHRSTVPASVNTDEPDPSSGFRFVQDYAIDAEIKQAITSGYALAGGQCAALVIRKVQDADVE